MDPFSRPNLNAALEYDSGTGGLYDSRVGKFKDQKWIWKSPPDGWPYAEKYFRHKDGAATLRSMAIRCSVRNCRNLTPEALEPVPYRLGKLIWKRIVIEQLNGFGAWKTFAVAYRDEDGAEALHHHLQQIPDADMSFSFYTEPVVSPSCQFLTILHLKSDQGSRADFMNLSWLSNLVALRIVGGRCRRPEDSVVDDSVIRAWSRKVNDDGAFPQLRVLWLEHLSMISSEWLSGWKTLAFLLSNSTVTCPYGWRPVKDDVSMKEFETEHSRIDLLSSLLDKVDDNVPNRTARAKVDIAGKPIFELSLGDVGRMPDTRHQGEYHNEHKCCSTQVYKKSERSLLGPSLRRKRDEPSTQDTKKTMKRFKTSTQRDAATSLAEFGL